MKRKRVREARDSLKQIRYAAIGDIVVSIIVLAGLAGVVGIVLGAEAVAGPIDEEIRRAGQMLVVAVAVLGVGKLVIGIDLLRCHNRVSEVFKEALPDEDDD